ncbi:hypothetical protein DPMN_122925 [Dreissena polymorpha]|uniref:Uncharacterized protein n=1 Tax=Dreissena polymorpha TaxID=45954 RepID=A0A9D4JQT3_DREPO|nr:hypothetical protein DPMN_119031 [Dreissena polymorpha]KAH3821165.1 hypothetical protein DPMN_122925 [Dreissena polymorpha]
MSSKSPNSNLTSSPASSGKGNFNFVEGGSVATKTTAYLQLPSQASAGAHTEQGQSCIAHPGFLDGSVSLSVPMISPGGFHHNRPTNIPATPITNYDDGQ